MPIINPPAFMQTGTYNARVTRLAFNDILESSGVVDNDSLRASQTTNASMAVKINPGGAYILGTEVYGQGLYYALLEQEITIPILPNNGGGARKDTIYIAIKDANISGGLNLAVIDVAQGTEGGSSAGLPPKNSTPIAVVTVDVGATSIPTSKIMSARVYPKLNSFILGQDYQTSMPGWTALSLSSNWSNYSANDAQFSYRQYADKVEIQGLVRYSGSPSQAQPQIALLPASIRPATRVVGFGIINYSQGSTVATTATSGSVPNHSHTFLMRYEIVRIDILPTGEMLAMGSSSAQVGLYWIAAAADQWISFAGFWYSKSS